MKLSRHAALADYTSLRTGGPAENLVELEAGDHLAEIVNSVSEGGPVWVLGYGTNCLISDQGLPGTVIINQIGSWRASGNRFEVDSGANWDAFVRMLISNNLWGLEFTSGIPGGSGAAVAGNIAAYGHKVADRFMEAKMLDTETGVVETWHKDRFKFNYRTSALQAPENRHWVVLSAAFELSDRPTGELEYESALKIAHEIGVPADSLENRRKIIMETRRRAGSLLDNPASGPWTAGSFFKNPLVDEPQIEAIITQEEHGVSKDQLLRQNVIHGQDKARVSAAHVLLAAGFRRGQTWGRVRLHPEHILKIENVGGASAKEIYEVVQLVLNTVKQKLGIELEPEVRILGEF